MRTLIAFGLHRLRWTLAQFLESRLLVQILYQVNAAGVDVRRVIDTQLQKLAGESDASSGAEGLKGGR